MTAWDMLIGLQILATFTALQTLVVCWAAGRRTVALGMVCVVVYLVVAGVNSAARPDLQPAPHYVVLLVGLMMLSHALAKRRPREVPVRDTGMQAAD
jgi:drug/metabolite transporter superfamily protein YnfA